MCFNSLGSSFFQKLIVTKPKNGKLQRKTAKHFASSNPYFNEDFLFVVNSIWKELDDYRLYIALVSKEKTCSDGTGFLGCLSFSLREVYSKRGPWPEWWWLLPQSSGFLSHEHVDKQVTEDRSIPRDQVVINGRSRANMMINGLYICVSGLHDARQVYKHRGNGLYLYFHGARKAWAVADSIGSSSPVAFCPSDCPTPDQTTVPWSVFSRERQFLQKTGTKPKAVRAEYVQDDYVKCQVATAADLVEYAADDDAPEIDISKADAAGLLPKKREVDFFVGRSADPSFVPGTKPLTVKGQNIVRWIRSQQGFVESLRAFELCRSELFRVSSQHPVFASIAKLRAVSEYFVDQLLTAQATDPDYDMPIGMLLMDIVPILAKPFVTFCTALDVKTNQLAALQTIENLERFDTASDQVRSAVGRVGGIDKLNAALQAPLLQIQRYPFYCMATMAACEPGDPDAETLVQASEWYKKLAAQCVAVSGSVAPNTKKPPVPVLSVSGHYVNYFYHGRISRAAAQEMFVDDGKSNGWFLIRKDKNSKSDSILSYGLNHSLKHVPVKYVDGAFAIAGRSFETMLELVRHFAVRRVELKTILTYPRLRRPGDAPEESGEDWSAALSAFMSDSLKAKKEAEDPALQKDEDARRAKEKEEEDKRRAREQEEVDNTRRNSVTTEPGPAVAPEAAEDAAAKKKAEDEQKKAAEEAAQKKKAEEEKKKAAADAAAKRKEENAKKKAAEDAKPKCNLFNTMALFTEIDTENENGADQDWKLSEKELSAAFSDNTPTPDDLIAVLKEPKAVKEATRGETLTKRFLELCPEEHHASVISNGQIVVAEIIRIADGQEDHCGGADNEISFNEWKAFFKLSHGAKRSLTHGDTAL